jgi:hypothetical protein
MKRISGNSFARMARHSFISHVTVRYVAHMGGRPSGDQLGTNENTGPRESARFF